jgi:hypothetical protein
MTELQPVEICGTLTATVSAEEADTLMRYFRACNERTEREILWSMSSYDRA